MWGGEASSWKRKEGPLVAVAVAVAVSVAVTGGLAAAGLPLS